MKKYLSYWLFWIQFIKFNVKRACSLNNSTVIKYILVLIFYSNSIVYLFFPITCSFILCNNLSKKTKIALNINYVSLIFIVSCKDDYGKCLLVLAFSGWIPTLAWLAGEGSSILIIICIYLHQIRKYMNAYAYEFF